MVTSDEPATAPTDTQGQRDEQPPRAQPAIDPAKLHRVGRSDKQNLMMSSGDSR